VKLILLRVPQALSFDAIGVSAFTTLPVYAARVVSKLVPPQVSSLTVPVVAAVKRYQTELSGSEMPAWLGSPDSPVALVFEPVLEPVPAI
jgi:hypothetical protein